MLVETIFNYPGIGRLLLEAVSNRDYPLMQALFLFTTVGVLIANLLADLLYGVLDPRVDGRRRHDAPTTPSRRKSPRYEASRSVREVPGWFVILWRNRKCRVGLIDARRRSS